MSKYFRRMILFILILSNLVFAAGFVFLGVHYNAFAKVVGKVTGNKVNTEREMQYSIQTGLHGVYRNNDVSIVMLGDSLTFGANWNELLDKNNVINRGIGSDTTKGILNRMENIISLNPDYCFILVGINDLRYGISVDDTFNNYKEILATLDENNITPIIQSILYTSDQYKGYKALNKKVSELNELLLGFAEKNSIEYIDLNSTLSSENVLINEYTYDGLHLLENAYQEWSNLIENNLSDHQ